MNEKVSDCEFECFELIYFRLLVMKKVINNRWNVWTSEEQINEEY